MNRSVETHLRNLGALVANLQTLEFYLRAVLSELPDSSSCGLAPSGNIYDLKVNDEVLSCPMTDFDTFGELIKKYNRVASTRDWGYVDTTLVDIRDALAHGRVAYPSDEHRYARLMKFSKPCKDGKLRVTFNDEMSPEWFEKHIKRTSGAHRTVSDASLQLRSAGQAA